MFRIRLRKNEAKREQEKIALFSAEMVAQLAELNRRADRLLERLHKRLHLRLVRSR